MKNRPTFLKPSRRIFILLFVFILFWGCGKRNDNNWLFYDETFCADQWERTNNNEQLKTNITDYFDRKDVRIYQIEIFTDRTPETCAACNCKTGRRIKVKVKGKDVSAMKSEQFYE